MKIFEQKKQERKKTLKTPLFIVTAILVLLTNCSKTEPIKPNSTLSDEINNQKYVDILEKRLSTLPEETQVSIALVTQENTEYIGVINKNNTLKTTNNANNIFEIGSITKVFTSIALSSMINNNEVSLSESLQEQFDFPILNVGNITFKHMANHTSGLPRLPNNIDEIENFNPKDPYATYTFNNLKSYLQNHVTLNNPIGSTYEYSNIATGILGYCLAKKRNTTYEQLLQELIFKPLNMDRSTTLLSKVNISDLIEPRNINGEIQSHWNFAETTTATGSIKSSVKDMEKFIRKNFENNPVYNLPQQKTFEKETDNYVGLGWGIYESEDFSLLAHDGGTGGFSSILIIDKNKKIGVLILSNVEDYHEKITPMCNDFIIELSKQ